MENQHRKITGYRELTQPEVDLMNEAKAIERRFNSFVDKLRGTQGVDQRNVALAQTHGEDAFMRAVRSIAQPLRQTMADDAAFPPGAGMTRYAGTKVVDATPMTRAAYNTLRGWTLPADENGADEGYLVEYADKAQEHVPGFQGYVSWSPRDVFEAAYRPI